MTEFDYLIRVIVALYFLFCSFYVYAKIYKKKIEPFFEKIDNTIIFDTKNKFVKILLQTISGILHITIAFGAIIAIVGGIIFLSITT